MAVTMPEPVMIGILFYLTTNLDVQKQLWLLDPFILCYTAVCCQEYSMRVLSCVILGLRRWESSQKKSHSVQML